MILQKYHVKTAILSDIEFQIGKLPAYKKISKQKVSLF